MSPKVEHDQLQQTTTFPQCLIVLYTSQWHISHYTLPEDV